MKRILTFFSITLLAGCAGFQKTCTQFGNSTLGSDWIVVQYDMNMRPTHCWKLQNAVVESEGGGNVSWVDSNGHLIHITGWENRAQVSGGNYATAAKALGVLEEKCVGGEYIR